MTEAELLASAIRSAAPSVKSGTLRFWGEWFGRPYDNLHRLVGVEATGDELLLHFDGGERLSVFRPVGLEATLDRFRIRDAKRVRWEWHWFGHPKTPENLRFMEFVKNKEGVKGTSDTHWRSKILQRASEFAAVEIL